MCRGFPMSSTSICLTPFEAYTHRTGRTGRATCAGDAFTFMTSDDHRIVQQIKKALGSDMPVKTIGGLSPENHAGTGAQAEDRRPRRW